MNWPIFIALIAASAILMILERRGVPLTLNLTFKGDIKRESQFLAQYGQSVCTPIIAILVWQLDGRGGRAALALLCAVMATSASAFVIKRLAGRVRPNRENAGRFLGLTLKHANYRESFPSSHSACAVALSTALARLYPAAGITFWSLAIITALLRYVLDAHWASDVVFGCALGYIVAHYVLLAFGVA